MIARKNCFEWCNMPRLDSSRKRVGDDEWYSCSERVPGAALLGDCWRLSDARRNGKITERFREMPTAILRSGVSRYASQPMTDIHRRTPQGQVAEAAARARAVSRAALARAGGRAPALARGRRRAARVADRAALPDRRRPRRARRGDDQPLLRRCSSPRPSCSGRSRRCGSISSRGSASASSPTCATPCTRK